MGQGRVLGISRLQRKLKRVRIPLLHAPYASTLSNEASVKGKKSILGEQEELDIEDSRSRRPDLAAATSEQPDPPLSISLTTSEQGVTFP
ncbi:hypothetical protein E2562_009163 [Oryza meyeriana var. granulata]|uniref:Uncharacterized protein n=1 Tax=Oryza meyeriana var. granulata TaxID=110450 RepID=A0A6G1CGC3_9ORYZ|nr:hypothetical protein E2562_009163 [Oryza meyeriana var. granulata]